VFTGFRRKDSEYGDGKDKKEKGAWMQMGWLRYGGQYLPLSL